MTDFEDIFKQIAQDMNTTVSDIKNTIEEIAKKGLKSTKVKERHFWLQVPKKGDFPTAEEIITFLSLIAYNSGNAEIVSLLNSEQI